MKKRMFVCFFVFMACLFYLSMSNFVFGQEQKSPAQQVFDNYKNLLQREDIQRLFPGFLRIFKRSDIQSALDPTIIEVILNNPLSYQELDPKIDNQFLLLLSTDDELRKLFREPQFYTVFDDPQKIEEFARLIETERPRRPTKLTVVSGDLQEGVPQATLGDPLMVLVQDQYGDALPGIDVTFRVTKGGRLSQTTDQTKGDGRAQTTFTLGSEPRIYQVEASVADYPSLTQTFTAAAIGVYEKPPPRPTALNKLSEDDQSGEVDKPLAQPFVVVVKDRDENPLSGVDVTFMVTAGGGNLWGKARQTISTNEEGKAGITLTLGPEKGINRVTAVVGTTLTETFIAAATTARPTTSLPVVYWIENGEIFQFGGETPETVIKNSSDWPEDWTATSLAVDTARNKLYWTAKRKTGKMKGSIWEVPLNGRNPKMLKQIQAAPRGIVVDAENGKLYWTTDNERIHRFNINDKNFNAQFIKKLGSPHHIALDLKAKTAHGDIYWTVDNGDESWSIWRTSLDGTIITKEIVPGLKELGGIAVDRDKLYWTEKIGDNHGKISCASKNGAGIRKLVPIEEDREDLFSLPGSVPLGLAVDEVGRRLYWTDNGGNIRSLNLDEPIKIVVRSQSNNSRSNNPTGAIALGRSSVPASPTAPSTIVEHSVESTLLANYPNPFNPETWIPYQLSAAADVSVSIYSVNGHLVRRLDLGHQVAGVYRNRSRAAYWDGRNAFGERVASGLYFYTLTAGDFTATRKMLIRK